MTVKSFLLQHGRQLGALFGLVILCAVLWTLTPYFLTISNQPNIAQQTFIKTIMAVGMTFVFITAGRYFFPSTPPLLSPAKWCRWRKGYWRQAVRNN